MHQLRVSVLYEAFFIVHVKDSTEKISTQAGHHPCNCIYIHSSHFHKVQTNCSFNHGKTLSDLGSLVFLGSSIVRLLFALICFQKRSDNCFLDSATLFLTRSLYTLPEYEVLKSLVSLTILILLKLPLLALIEPFKFFLYLLSWDSQTLSPSDHWKPVEVRLPTSEWGKPILVVLKCLQPKYLNLFQKIAAWTWWTHSSSFLLSENFYKEKIRKSLLLHLLVTNALLICLVYLNVLPCYSIDNRIFIWGHFLTGRGLHQSYGFGSAFPNLLDGTILMDRVAVVCNACRCNKPTMPRLAF